MRERQESAVKELAIESFMGRLKDNLYTKNIELMVDEFMAEHKIRESLRPGLTLNCRGCSFRKLIIYIPEFQNILGSTSFHLDISGSLMPYLQKGDSDNSDSDSGV